jgi:hypothetical protein
MKRAKSLFVQVCSFALATAQICLAEGRLVIESQEGVSCFMEIPYQTPFGEVFEIIEKCLPEDRIHIEFAEDKKFIAKAVRNYAAIVTSQERSDIHFVVKTLGNDSLLGIKQKESQLKKAGKRIESVHPLLFLTTIFANDELKAAIQNMKGRSWVWKRFLEDLTDNLKEEHHNGNVLPFAEDFAAKIAMDSQVIKAAMIEAKWQKFVIMLIDRVPRNNDIDRYKM